MMGVLTESQTRSRQLKLQTRLRRGAERRMTANNLLLEREVGRLVDERRRAGDEGEHRDLLSCMLTGVDKRSGERLPDENIVAQCLTFLIAGHETTSGLLSFAIAALLRRPDVVARAQEEVDGVLGADLRVPPTLAQVQGLTYVTQVVNETLRLWPTAPAFTRYPYTDTELGGYLLPRGISITALTPMLHRLPEVWGPDAEDFEPDHFRPEQRSALPPNAFKPFGSGQRACIGRQFAMQEAVLVLGMLLQRFDFIDHLNYRLTIRESLTLKPDGLRIRLKPRRGSAGGPGLLPRTATPTPEPASPPRPGAVPRDPAPTHGTPLLVLFGSNLGTAEGVATRIAREGTDRGFAVSLAALDDHAGRMPDTGALVVVCASYNGQPPDNAERFCRWLQSKPTADRALSGLLFTVFGCGNMDWASTYQAVPKLIDAGLEALGAVRVHRRGEGDARTDFDGQYEDWHAGLWSSLGAASGVEGPAVAVQSSPRLRVTLERHGVDPGVVPYGARPARVLVNRELVRAHESSGQPRSTRHIALDLPADVDYAVGDHLAVVPRNRAELVTRVLDRFGLDSSSYVTISAARGTCTHLPQERPTPVAEVLAGCVELQDVASRSDLAVLAGHASDPGERQDLLSLAALDDEGRTAYRKQVAGPRAGVLDLLDEFPSCDLPFGAFLEMLPPLRPRYYSISSAPAATAHCELTVGVLRAPSRRGGSTFAGVCSTHLSEAVPGSTVLVFPRKPRIPFRPPENPHVPLVMIAAGTGVAPFRGFLQHRALLHQRGVPLGDAVLFFGCRSPEVDYLYAEELAGHVEAGLAEVHTAFSRHPTLGRTFVQDLVAQQQDRVWELIDGGAVVYVCGNAATMAPGVRSALTDMHRARTGGSDAAAREWLDQLRDADRFLEDIWGEQAVTV